MKKTLVLLLLSSMAITAHAEKIKAKWSSAGELSGKYKHCIAINEPLEPEQYTWDDNYLCFNKKNHGIEYSYAGKIPGKKCIKLNLKGGAWKDNYICAKRNNIAFFQRQLPGGYRCIRLVEPSDPNPLANGKDGNSNHFCIKK